MIASAAAFCSVPSRASRASTSSSVATAIWQSRPVAIWTSSTASTLAGSAVGDQQRVLVDVADRDRLVAARHRHREERRGAHVHLVDGEVDVVEPVALGDRARELLGADLALLEQQRLRRAAGDAGLLDRRLGDLSGGVAELDQDVGDEAPRVAAVQRRGQAGHDVLRRARQRRRGRGPRVGDRAQVAGWGSSGSCSVGVVVDDRAVVVGVAHRLDNVLGGLEAVADAGLGSRR